MLKALGMELCKLALQFLEREAEPARTKRSPHLSTTSRPKHDAPVAAINKREYGFVILTPKRIEKGLSAEFEVWIHPKELQQQVKHELGKVSPLYEPVISEPSSLSFDTIIIVELYCPYVRILNNVRSIQVKSDRQKIKFTGEVLQDGMSGIHNGNLVIKDKTTGVEIKSIGFKILIVDYAFDHISRSDLNTAMAVVSGMGSVAAFLVTQLGGIEEALAGYTTAVAGLGVAGTLVFQNSRNQRPVPAGDGIVGV
jgi:hypothetical protein